MKSQFRKGILDAFLLAYIIQGETYGYSIVNRIKEILPEIDANTIYGVLRRLKSNGCLESYEVKSKIGPNRKCLKVTEAGESYFNDLIDEWRNLNHKLSLLDINV